MKFKIETDLIPKKSGVSHSRDNWPSPEADKMNDAYDYLNELEHKGFLKLWFDSKTQNLTIVKEECSDLSNNEIGIILSEMENKLKELKTSRDRTSGFIDSNETPPEI